jgi:APA family basic amino acid/polyamine antiporter
LPSHRSEALFSADAWNNVTFTAGEVKNPSRNLAIVARARHRRGDRALHRLQFCVSEARCRWIGNPAGTTLLARGIQYATEDRVATAVMTQMFGRESAARSWPSPS